MLSLMQYRFPAIVIAGMLTAGFLTYGSSLRNDFLTYDDDLFVTRHPLVISGTWTDLPQIFTGFDAELFMPLTIASLKLDYAVAGAQPFQFHLTSLLLHILSACLIVWLCMLLFKHRTIALFLGAVFLLHPLNTEVVAWVAARKDALSTPFFLGASIAYLYAQDRKNRQLMITSIALFAAGLTAKYMIVTLPAFLIVLDMLRGARPGKAMAKRIAPFVVLSAVFTLIALLGKQTGLGAPVGGVALLAGKTTLWYLQLFLFPDNLRILYLQETPARFTLEFVLPWLAIISIATAGCFLRRFIPGLVLGLAYFFIALIPTFPAAVKHGEYFGADHYAYLPMIGLLVGIGWVMVRLKPRRSKRQFIGIVTILLVVQLGAIANRQARTWRNSDTVFARALEYHPCSIVAHNNRAASFAQTGEVERARSEYEQAIACEPTSARLHINMANFLAGIGEDDAALDELTQAVNLAPLSAEVHFALGLYFQKRGRESDAKAAFENALKLDPNYVERKLRNWAM